MPKRIPADAFEAYFALGADRSYQALAEKYGVSKKAVTLAAKRGGWQARLTDLERNARETSDKKMRESLEEEAERRARVLRFLEAKAVEALRSMSISTVGDAIRAIDTVFRARRPPPGSKDPASATAVINVLQLTREEHDRRSDLLRTSWHKSCNAPSGDPEASCIFDVAPQREK